MENKGTLEIRISGQSHGKNLTPDTYDIKELASMLHSIEDILYPNAKERPLITLEIEEGSVRHKFKTALQAIISSTAIFSAIEENGNLDFLELKTAKAVEGLQNLAYNKGYSLEISSSTKDHILTITPATKYLKTENYFVESEMYFYGEITTVGGSTNPTFRLNTQEFGTLYIKANREYIKELDANPVYKNTGIRTKVRQNMNTGEFDRQEVHFIQMIEYESSFDEDYLNNLIKKSRGKWEGDTDKWLKDLRGGFDA